MLSSPALALGLLRYGWGERCCCCTCLLMPCLCACPSTVGLISFALVLFDLVLFDSVLPKLIRIFFVFFFGIVPVCVAAVVQTYNQNAPLSAHTSYACSHRLVPTPPLPPPLTLLPVACNQRRQKRFLVIHIAARALGVPHASAQLDRFRPVFRELREQRGVRRERGRWKPRWWRRWWQRRRGWRRSRRRGKGQARQAGVQAHVFERPQPVSLSPVDVLHGLHVRDLPRGDAGGSWSDDAHFQTPTASGEAQLGRRRRERKWPW